MPAAPRRELPPRRDVGPAHELIFMVRGAAAISTWAQSYALTRGRLLLVDPGVEHAESPRDPHREYVMLICELHRTHCFLGHSSYSPSGSWREGPDLSLTGHTHLQSLAAAMSSELYSRQPGWERAVSGLLGYLTSLILRRLRVNSKGHRLPPEPPALQHDARFSHVMETVVQYCHAHLHDPIRLSAVAAAVGYSPTHISHLFTSRLGRTFSDYLRSLRLGVAHDLLVNTDLPVAEIARSVGYCDPAHFTRAFARTYHVSPRVHRQRQRPV